MGPRLPCLSIYPLPFTDRIRMVLSTTRDILASSIYLRLGKGATALGCSTIYIESHIVDIHIPRAKMQAKLLQNSLSEPQLQLESQSLTPRKRKVQTEQSGYRYRYIQGNLPSFSESVSSGEKIP